MEKIIYLLVIFSVMVEKKVLPFLFFYHTHHYNVIGIEFVLEFHLYNYLNVDLYTRFVIKITRRSWPTPGFMCVCDVVQSQIDRVCVCVCVCMCMSEKERKRGEWSDSARTQYTAAQGSSNRSNNLSFL
jgi:hypothetical protein